MMGESRASFDGAVEERQVDSCPVYVLTPDGITDADRRVYLDIHGGAWVLGSGELCRMMAGSTASQVGARTWAVDYRMPA
jgi:monoterpene epsilon-lactone hydrolase